ncbi:MAG: hypothetical protein OEX07_07670 [Gammaproteobacteria bacterium]|nr:hypothetical protein [Gammaproteobacteria bacterium]
MSWWTDKRDEILGVGEDLLNISAPGVTYNVLTDNLDNTVDSYSNIAENLWDNSIGGASTNAATDSLGITENGVGSGSPDDDRDPDDHKASQINADLVRSEWEDYKTRFRPKENELIGHVNNKAERAQAVTRARESVGQGFTNAKAQVNQNLGQYGMTMTGAQKKSSDRRMKLTEAASKAGASNTTRQFIRDRDLNIIGGGMNAART